MPGSRRADPREIVYLRDKATAWRLTEVAGTLKTFGLVLTVNSTDPKVIRAIEWAAAQNGLAIERMPPDESVLLDPAVGH